MLDSSAIEKEKRDPLLSSEHRENEEVNEFEDKNYGANRDPYHDEDKLVIVKLTPYLSAEARANLPHY
jgi:hypothetical protein